MQLHRIIDTQSAQKRIAINALRRLSPKDRGMAFARASVDSSSEEEGEEEEEYEEETSGVKKVIRETDLNQPSSSRSQCSAEEKDSREREAAAAFRIHLFANMQFHVQANSSDHENNSKRLVAWIDKFAKAGHKFVSCPFCNYTSPRQRMQRHLLGLYKNKAACGWLKGKYSPFTQKTSPSV